MFWIRLMSSGVFFDKGLFLEAVAHPPSKLINFNDRETHLDVLYYLGFLPHLAFFLNFFFLHRFGNIFNFFWASCDFTSAYYLQQKKVAPASRFVFLILTKTKKRFDNYG